MRLSATVEVRDRYDVQPLAHAFVCGVKDEKNRLWSKKFTSLQHDICMIKHNMFISIRCVKFQNWVKIQEPLQI